MIPLKSGSSGEPVRELQRMLNAMLKTPPPLNVDGLFGPKTHARVLEFQKANKLVADGIVGPNTSKVLVGSVLARTLRLR